MVTVARELALVKGSCEIRVQPKLAFVQELMAIGLQLEESFPHWQTDGLSLRFLNAKTRSAVSLRHNQFLLEIDLPSGMDAFESLFRRTVGPYLKSTHIKTVLRTGVRGQYLCTQGFKFEELVSIFDERLLRVSPETNEFMRGKLLDLMFNVVVERTDYTYHLVSGPVRREELGRWTSQIAYNVGEPPEPIEYPEVATLIDIDVYTLKPLSPKELEAFVTKGMSVLRDTAKSFSQFLFEERA